MDTQYIYLVLFLLILIVVGCGMENVLQPTEEEITTGYVDPCGPDAILIGDICVPRSDFSEEELARLMQRTEKELECESLTAAGVAIEDIPDYCKEEKEGN